MSASARPTSQPLVSCIVPVYNGEAFLWEALDSIFAQTYRNLDVIVVDDGSTDGSRDLVAGYPRPVQYIQQANSGPAAARNSGLRAARGELISFLDADDVWHPDKLRLQLELLEQHPELGACVTLIQNFWVESLRDEREAFRGHQREQPIPGYSSVTLLARKSVFDAIGGFDTRLKHGDDTDWFLRADERGIAVGVVPELLVHRRVHPHSRSRQWQERSRNEYLDLLKAHLDRVRALKRSSPRDDPASGPADPVSD
jgi:glycosyltransferase involved in cell wall biosynthesis